MSFSGVFIKKPIMTTLATVVVVIFGIAAFRTLPISDLPVVDSPVITVSVAYPGASPQTMASTVASPLENEFMQIPGLVGVISDNTEGSTSITLTFELDRSVDLAAPDVLAAIQRATANLPTDLPSPPTYTKTNPSDQPIVYLSLVSDTMTPGELYDYGNNTIGKRVSMISGVSQVQVWGSKRAIRIQADPNKIAAFQIGINEIADAVQQGTVIVPGGSLNGRYRAYSIEPQGQLFQAKDFEDLIVAYRNGAPVKMRDVAVCLDGVQNDDSNVMYGHTDGPMRKGAVIIAVSRVAGANTVDLSRRIRNTVDTLKNELPGSVRFEIFYDKSISIVESIDDVKNTIIIALILVILVIYLFLGRISDTVIPSVTLPLSLLASFIVMSALGFSLNNLSLMGLILAIGLVVDDAIVVLENTVRLIEKGMKPLDASAKSASEITFTIITMTVSLAIIFVPLVFMGGTIGRMFREFAVTVVVAIMCSGIISLTLTPMMCARMLKPKTADDKPTLVQVFMNRLMEKIMNAYRISLRATLVRPLSTLIIWLLCIAGTGFFFTVLPKAFLPEGDSGAIIGGILMPLGTSSKQIQSFQDKLNGVIKEDPNVERFITISGLNPGADQSTGMVVIVLKEKRKPMQEVLMEVRKKIAHFTEGFVFLKAIPNLEISVGGESTATGSKYSYMMSSPDQDKLYKSALALEMAMRKTPGLIDIQNSVKLNMPQVELRIFRDRASTLGITAQEIENALTLSYAGGKVTTYKTDVDQYYIIVELMKDFQDDPENLSHIYLHSKTTGGLIPLKSIAEWTLAVGPQDVPHYDQLNSATISFNVEAWMPLGKATDAVAALAVRTLPPDVTGRLQGEAEEFQDAIASLGILVLVAIFLKYVVLGILYESYVHPFTILTTLPVATLGGLITLYLFSAQLSLYAYVGIFLLLGIVAKNGIMMVDFANQIMVEEKKSSLDAIYDACIIRFRPILMTGVAAIMGALPIALGYGADGSSRIPLGLVVVGGLIFSQVVTLYVTPGLFLYMQRIQEKYLDRFEMFRSKAARGKEE
ncbi:MAG: efflux RND transporter permease subunit [Candidatus Omnitrophica bacterium]|nr:efflux RND transporter permease subunit [Candidatus Omnitrophota bacterium]